MNPTATVRLRRATAALALAWALAAFAFSVAIRLDAERLYGPPFFFEGLATDPWRIASVAPEAEASGVETGDRLVGIDGWTTGGAIHRWRQLFRADATNLYEIEKRDGRTVQVVLAPRRPADFFTPLLWVVAIGLPVVGLVYLGIGMWVWRLRPDRASTWALFLFCCTMAAELALPPVHGRFAWTMVWLNIPLIGAATFHLFTTYPSEPPWVVRTPSLRWIPYAIALLLGTLAGAESWSGMEVPLAKKAAFWFTICLCLVSLGVGWHERRRVRETKAAGRADVMLLGAAISFVPAILAILSRTLLGTSFPWVLGFFSFFVFPLAVAYGIVKRQLFEIRVVAKSSATYGAVTFAITGVYAALIIFADAAVSRFNMNARSPWFSVGFLFFAILAFNPLRDRMQALVDRLFDRDHSLYRRAVREISEAMVSMLSTKEVVDRILVALTETMGVERAMVMLQEEGGQRLGSAASRGEWDDEALGSQIGLEHPLCRRLLARRDPLARDDFDDEPDLEVRELCRDVFDQLEVELLVPILFGAELLGVVAVGRKLSGEGLSADDTQLLRTLANQSSIAIENAKAFDEIADLNATLEARVDERTRELHQAQAQLVHGEKMRSLGQLVAGVAHELNNPIGFVHANLQLLQEYVPKLAVALRAGEDTAKIETAIDKLLARSREGTERVKQIVADLRTFSRMEQAVLSDVDMNREIERALTLTEPRFKDGIEVVRDYTELPPVRCYAGQLNQVFTNLLMNACDALDGKGTVTVRTRPRRSGASGHPIDGVRLEFHDDGPGMSPDVQARIFEPFFTTKPVGQGTGLGLSISYGIVERHGGRMLVGSSPTSGTTFVVELPLVAKRMDDATSAELGS
jgi:signal transduction histidine kinase